MKNIGKCWVLLFLWFTLCGVQAKAFTNEARIAAVVNESSILTNELESRIRLVMSSGGLENTPEVRSQIKQQVLKLMIDEHLQLQMAKKFEMLPSDEDVEQAYLVMEQRNGMQKGELDKFLRANQVSKSILLQQIKAGIGWRNYVQERYQRQVPINERDVKLAMDRLEVDKNQEQVLLAEILLNFDHESPKDEKAVLTQANKFVEQIRRGATFSALAQQFSRSASAARGGDIGWVSVNQLSESLRDVVKTAELGTVANPIRTVGSYHILMVRDRREAGSLGRSETLLSFEQVLFPWSQQLPESELESIFRTATAVSYNARSCSMLRRLAGDVEGAQIKGVKSVPASSLNTQLKALLLKLPEGKASQPVSTSIGALVFIVCDKQEISPEESSEKEIRHKLLESKLSLVSQRELRNLRRAAFIDIRV